MKFKKTLLTLLGLSLFCYGKVSALNSTGNPDFIRTLNRTASVGTLDAMFFNPAGLVYADNGMYLQFGLDIPAYIKGINFQATPQKGNSYGQDCDGLNLPSVCFGFVNKKDKGALYVTLISLDSSLISFKKAAYNPDLKYFVNYRHYDIGYETTVGYAMKFHDMVAFSIGGRLLTEFSGVNDYFKDARGEGDIFQYDICAGSLALQTGLTVKPLSWFAVALNLHSGTLLVANSYNTGLEANVLQDEARKLPPSPRKLLVLGDPIRVDLGVLFKIKDIAALQLDGQVQIDLFEETNGSILGNILNPKPAITWKLGLGSDFNLPTGITVGCGILYAQEMLRPAVTPFEIYRAIEKGRLQSISWSFGTVIPVTENITLNGSGMMSVYFDGWKLTSNAPVTREAEFKVDSKVRGFVAIDMALSAGMTIKL